MNSGKVKVGLIGAGHLGKIHLNLMKEIEEIELIGFYDIDGEKSAELSKSTGLAYYPILNSLIEKVEALDIVTPTASHYEYALKAIKSKKHFFVEKPVTTTLSEAEDLINLVEGTGLKAQVGHVERFNPAYQVIQSYPLQPMFIEAQRLAEYKPRSTDVSVVLDLMIHDLDLILHIVNSKVDQISASGVAVISNKVDIANARVEFENGCVANITASRVSLKNERKMRIFQQNTYMSLDFHKKETNIFRLKELRMDEKPSSEIVIDPGEGLPRKEIFYQSPETKNTNAIKEELTFWARSILADTIPPVTLQDGYNALKLAYQILEKIDETFLKAKIH